MRTDRILYAGLGLAAMFALPACGLDESGTGTNNPNFLPGPQPQSHVVFCDIEVMRACAPDADTAANTLPLTNAAFALNTGQTSQTALDKSSAAMGRCPSFGEIVTFHGPFPQGDPECLNCGAQIPSVFADANAVCQAACDDISQTGLITNPPPSDVATFCSQHARVSTNVPKNGCPTGFDLACTDAGSLLPTYEAPFDPIHPTDPRDPRIFPEAVAWTQLTGVTTGGVNNNDLTMTAPTVPNTFTAQAVSSQTLSGGDAYLEFSVGETNLAHVIGFTQLPQSCLNVEPCPATDGDVTPGDIDFALRLGVGGLVFVSHLGTLVNGSGIQGPGEVATYQAGDRLRITLTDLNNGSFSLQYGKVNGACTPGLPCNVSNFFTDGGTGTYPVRVDTSFRDTGAHLINVTLVRIQPQ